MVLSGLQSNTDYEVTISASSLAGSGPVDTKTVSTFANGKCLKDAISVVMQSRQIMGTLTQAFFKIIDLCNI